MTDATLVTGASGGRAPRKGDVLAERYEIVEVLASDSLVVSYRAVDQESDAPVLVRCTAPGLLGDREARGMVDRLRPLVGGGGRVVSALRTVDRDGGVVLTIEPWPRGGSLRALLDARRASGEGVLSPREVLPIVAHLATAIASIPEPYWHGDLRAERVYLDEGCVVLTGGFLLSMLAGDLVSGTLENEPALAHGLAPELTEGLGGRASDRWGVAALAWEALTGRVLGEGRPTPPPALGGAGVELARALDPDPAARPPTLDALVAAIAELAGMPVPVVEKDAFPGVEHAAVEPDETTQVSELAAPPTDPANRANTIPAPPAVLAPSLAAPVAAAAPSAAGSRNDTAPHAALDAEGRPRVDDLDPRLVRAALASEPDAPVGADLDLADSKTDPAAKVGPDSKTDPAAKVGPDSKTDPAAKVGPEAATGGDLDPDLVRAALAPKPPAPPPPKPPARPHPGAPGERGPGARAAPAIPAPPAPPSAPDASATAAPGAPVAAPPPAKAAKPRRRLREPEPVPLPTDIKPIPRPRLDERDELPVGPVLFDASRPQPVAPATVPVASAPVTPVASAPAPIPAPAPPPAPAPTAAPVASGRSAWTSWAIVAVAVLVAIAIVGGGFWYRASVQREAERKQLIEQRLREIHSTTP